MRRRREAMPEGRIVVGWLRCLPTKMILASGRGNGWCGGHVLGRWHARTRGCDELRCVLHRQLHVLRLSVAKPAQLLCQELSLKLGPHRRFSILFLRLFALLLLFLFLLVFAPATATTAKRVRCVQNGESPFPPDVAVAVAAAAAAVAAVTAVTAVAIVAALASALFLLLGLRCLFFHCFFYFLVYLGGKLLVPWC
jgi:hypothetical protein